MGMVSISREGYSNAAGSHAGSENIDEWLKKKYDIQQQNADANTMLADARRIEADSLAKQRNWEWNPELESSQGVGGYRFLDLARLKNLDASVIARNKADTDRLSAMAEEQKQENDFNKEINPYLLKNSKITASLNDMVNERALREEQERQRSEWAGKNLAKASMYTPPSKPKKSWLEIIFGRGPLGTGIGDALYEYNNPEIADPNYDKYIARMKALAASNKSKLAEYDNRFALPKY